MMYAKVEGEVYYMKKNILFYKLDLVFNSQLNMFTTDADLKSRVKAFANNCDKNEMSYTN